MGWVATCNTVGQTAGYFVGNVIFLTLESADFCNKYIYSQHETHGLVTLAGLLQLICDVCDWKTIVSTIWQYVWLIICNIDDANDLCNSDNNIQEFLSTIT